jgi:hypothetical protein
MTTSITCTEPNHFQIDKWRIVVRRLATDDLPCLSPKQADSFLASQNLTVLQTQSEGNPLRATARWADQKTAAADPQATWFLRVEATI